MKKDKFMEENVTRILTKEGKLLEGERDTEFDKGK